MLIDIYHHSTLLALLEARTRVGLTSITPSFGTSSTLVTLKEISLPFASELITPVHGFFTGESQVWASSAKCSYNSNTLPTPVTLTSILMSMFYSTLSLPPANLVVRLSGLAIVFAEDPDETVSANSNVPGM